MKIVEYNDSLAAKIADMWNKSGSNWGDDDSNRTAEDIIQRENSSGNIKLYLAMDNDEVVGYCSFSEYEHDEGASYLPLLNVRPDYHGKKVGKALILKVLEEAINAPWPRFDLYTWSGNIKAMPLYKKCGFFWEKSSDGVHLMNFLPYMFKIEALKEYMKDINWYQDSKRVIDMNQDGNTINGFDYYQYHFENESMKVITEFEKTGRGLRLIETPDYRIEMTLPNNELVYGKDYEVEFKIKNKSNKDLQVKLVGKNNKNVVSSFLDEYDVKDEIVVSKPFFVGETRKPQNKRKTHPVVEVDVYINGKKAVMKCGLNPKSPLGLNLVVKEYTNIIGREYVGYLDLENNLEDKTSFKVDFPKSQIEVLNNVEITLNPKEKRSLKLDYKVLENGFYNEDVTVTYNEDTIQLPVKGLIKGVKDNFTALFDKHAFVVSGNYVCVYERENHNIVILDRYRNNVKTAFMTPQLGLPFSLEFSNHKPEILFPENNKMDLVFTSNEFKGLKLIVHVEHTFGLVEIHYEVRNEGEERTLALHIPVWQTLGDCYVPYDNKILKSPVEESYGLNGIESKYIDENWMYAYKERVGFSWDKSMTFEITGWKLGIKEEGITLKNNESYTTGNFYLSAIHSNYKEFRAFAGYKEERDMMQYLDFVVNDGNPFFSGEKEAHIRFNQKKQAKGHFVLDNQKVDIKESVKVTPGFNTFTYDTTEKTFEHSHLSFETKGKVSCELVKDSHVVNNGEITFKVSNDYSDALYSLEYQGKEWLDSHYPTPKERSWWGTFLGGVHTRKNGVQNNIVLKEKRNTEFVSLKDNFGNNWEGIKSTVVFEKEKDLKGYTYESFYVTLPGVPLLYSFTNVINKSGKVVNDNGYNRFNVVNVSDSKEVSFDMNGVNYNCYNVGMEKDIKKLVVFTGDRDAKMAFYNKKNEYLVESEKTFTICFTEGRMNIPDGESSVFEGDFIFFTKENINKDSVKDLENIKIEV